MRGSRGRSPVPQRSFSAWKVAVCASTRHVDGTQNVKPLAATRRHAVLSGDPGSQERRDAEDEVSATGEEEEADGCAHPAARSSRRAVARRRGEIVIIAESGWESTEARIRH